MSTTADAIVPSMRTTLLLSDLLLKGVTDANWATLAKGVLSNHPAWVFGHLSLYPDRMFEAMGRADLARPKPEEYQAVFRAKTDCRDDPKRTIYPSMEEVTTHYRERYNALISVVAETSEEVFARPNPIEPLKDRGVTTLGGVVCFMGVFHPSMHLGQVSAWRRAMGLGSAM